MNVLTLWIGSIWVISALVMIALFVVAPEMEDDGRD